MADRTYIDERITAYKRDTAPQEDTQSAKDFKHLSANHEDAMTVLTHEDYKPYRYHHLKGKWTEDYTKVLLMLR